MMPRLWKYVIENGKLYAVCPDCKRKMIMFASWESNPYHKCPFCWTMRELYAGWYKRWREKAYGKQKRQERIEE